MARSRSRSPPSSTPIDGSGHTRTDLPPLEFSKIAGSFGALLECRPPVTVSLLLRSDVGEALRDAWHKGGGLLVLRGLDAMTPRDLVAFSSHFGEVQDTYNASRHHALVSSAPVLRLGNVKGLDGKFISVPSASKITLASKGDCRYRPDERWPVWHTDGCHYDRPPVGSAFFCRQAPVEGAETCFADARAAWDMLTPEEQQELEGLECICSLAHHDVKIHKKSPDYPTLTSEQRAANPPRRVPAVLEHPVTGRKAIYGFNSATCCIVPKGQSIEPTALDKFDLEGDEDESVNMLRRYLPRFTAPEFTVVWRWRVGDLVVWDNRSTMHTGTGYDQEKYTREMWRTSILPSGDVSYTKPL